MLTRHDDYPRWQRAISGPNGSGDWFYCLAPLSPVAGICERGPGDWSIGVNHQRWLARLTYATVPTQAIAEKMVERWARANRARLLRECKDSILKRGKVWEGLVID